MDSTPEKLPETQAKAAKQSDAAALEAENWKQLVALLGQLVPQAIPAIERAKARSNTHQTIRWTVMMGLAACLIGLAAYAGACREWDTALKLALPVVGFLGGLCK